MKKTLLMSVAVMLLSFVTVTAMAAVGKKYQVVFVQDFEDTNTFLNNWTTEGNEATALHRSEEDTNTFFSIKGTGNPNHANFSFLEVPEVSSLTDYEFSYIYGLCPSGASQGAEKNVMYCLTKNGENVDTLFSIYSYRPSSASGTVNAEIRRNDGSVITTMPIGKRYLAFPDYLYDFTVKSNASGITLAVVNHDNGNEILPETKLADTPLPIEGFYLDNSNSGITYSSMQVFDDITVKVPTNEDVAEVPSLYISGVLGAARMIGAKALPHETLHYTMTETEDYSAAEWDILEGESEYEIDIVEANSYVWAYTTYGTATSEITKLYVECGEVKLNPVTIQRKGDKSNDVTLSTSQADVLCKPVVDIHYTINGGEEQIAESKTSVTISITEDSKIVAWTVDPNECYTSSEQTEAEFALYVPEGPSEFTLYRWESDGGNVTEYGGSIAYVNGDGSNRINTSTGGYYSITINGKKANIDDETASANAGHMEITLNEGKAFAAGDIITMTAYKNNGDASKLSNPYFRTMPSKTAWFDDSINFGDVKIAGQTPTTETFIMPEGVDGDTMLQITRSKSNTNFFIAYIDIAHPDPAGINDLVVPGSAPATMYDIMGRKVTTVIPGNLYLLGGKKFIAK